MAGQNAVDQVGLPRDISSQIHIADSKSTPFTSMVKKGKRLVNALHEWQVDAYAEPEERGQIDGKDKESFENAAENRDVLKNRCMIFDRTAQVSTIAEQVNQPAGVKEGEFARAKAKKITEIKRDMEVRFLGDRDVVEPGAGDRTGSRGLGSWITNSAQATYPVPASYRTPSASINTTNASSVQESHINAVLQSIFDEVGENKTYYGFVGTKLMRDFAEQTLYDAAAGDAAVAVRSYNQAVDKHKIDVKVSTYESDFGRVILVPSVWLAYYDSSNVKNSAAIRQGRGYILDMDDIQIRNNATPSAKDLPDLGGGPRCLIRAICTLEVGNPLKHGAFKPTA